MSAPSEECGNCRFWLLRKDHAGKTGGGYCRRFPPFFPSALQIIRPIRESGMAIAEIELSSGFLNDAWPNVHQQSWCGEFQPPERKDDLPW